VGWSAVGEREAVGWAAIGERPYGYGEKERKAVGMVRKRMRHDGLFGSG
jgi:hypothetical protein